MVGLSDYAALDGYNGSMAGEYSQQDVEMLFKAMSAGNITGRETNNMLDASGAALKVESLENTMKILTSQPKHTPLFSKVTKKPATNTVEEYNQLVSYGNFDGGFTVEGELPESADSIYRRKSQLVKFLGVVGGVTHPMQLVNTGSGVSNMIAQETKNKASLVMQMMEQFFPFADSRIVPEHFNGLLAQHETESEYGTFDAYMSSEHVIDCAGNVLTDTVIENGVKTSVDNFGLANTLIGPPSIFSNFVTRYHDKKMIYPVPQMVRDGVFGQRVNEIITQNGGVEILQSNFFRNSMKVGGKRKENLASSSKAPAAPTAVTAAAISDQVSKIRDFEVGDYYYAVTAKNRFGESALTLTTLATVTAGQAIDLTITPGTGSYAATGYCIYKTLVNPADNSVAFYKLFDIPATSVANGYDGSVNKVRDRFRRIPNTDESYLVEWDADQIFSFKQLAPMMKMNLAITAPISRFMILLYGTPILYAPRKTIRIINIGTKIPA